MHLVNDGVLAKFLNLGLDSLGFIWANIVLGQDLANTGNALFHHLIIVGGTVHSQQILQDERWHIGTALHHGGQVFTNDLARKMLDNLVIEFVSLQNWDGRRFLSVFHSCFCSNRS